MYLTVQVLSPPAVPVVSLDTMRQHLRVDSTYDDVLISLYTASASALCEAYLNRSLITRTLRLVTADSAAPLPWPYVNVPSLSMPYGWSWMIGHHHHFAQLPYGDVQSVTSVSYRSLHSDTETVLTLDTDYRVDLDVTPARIQYLDHQHQVAHRDITYVTGYGTDPASIPISIVHAVMLTTAKMYEARGDVGDDALLSRAARSCLDPYRIAYFG
jgi:hypothetical protein